MIDQHFTDTPSRIAGIGLAEIARESLTRHAVGFPGDPDAESPELDVGGEIMWRRRGEHHMWNPDTVQTLQHAVRKENREAYDEFAPRVERREPPALHAPRAARHQEGAQGRSRSTWWSRRRTS